MDEIMVSDPINKVKKKIDELVAFVDELWKTAILATI